MLWEHAPQERFGFRTEGGADVRGGCNLAQCDHHLKLLGGFCAHVTLRKRACMRYDVQPEQTRHARWLKALLRPRCAL